MYINTKYLCKHVSTMWFNTPSRFTVKKPILSHFASIMHDHFRFELLQQSDYKFSFQSDFPIYREFIDTLDSRYGLEVWIGGIGCNLTLF